MNIVTMVKFDARERQSLADALVHIRIGTPGFDDMDPKDEEAREVRSIGVAARGDIMSREALVRARAALTRLHDACVAESDPAHWEHLDLVPVMPLGEGAPLVHPNQDLGAVLVEARTRQAVEAREALVIINDALMLVPEVEPDE